MEWEDVKRAEEALAAAEAQLSAATTSQEKHDAEKAVEAAKEKLAEEVEEAEAARAAALVERGFAFVGLTEEWDASVCVFHRRFSNGPPAVEAERRVLRATAPGGVAARAAGVRARSRACRDRAFSLNAAAA